MAFRFALQPLLLAAVLPLAAGCQRYRPSPLDFARHAAAWEARDPAAAGVADYARRLAALADEPGAPYDPADGLTLREAEVVALFFNPQLRAARAKARVPAVGAAEAGRWEDPELAVDAERIIESVEHPWVLGGTLNFTLPLSGRPGLERRKALAEADAARVNALLEEARVIAELNAQWLDLAVLEQRTDLTRQYLAELGEVVPTAERLLRAGELGPVEANLFRIEQARRAAELRGMELERREHEVALKGLLGLVPDAGVRLVPSLPRATEHVATDQRRRWMEENHPRLRLARAEYEAAERSLELEVRRQYPDLTVGGGYGVDEDTHRLLGGLSIPLPLFNASRRAIAEARANRDAARAAAEATYEELVAALARAEVGLETARLRRESLEKDLAPLVDAQVRDARRLGKLGDLNTVVLLEALTRAYETRVELLEAVAKEAAAVNRLNTLLRPGTGLEPQGEEHP